MSGVRHLTVGPDEAEQRLDRWLRRQFPELSQGRIEKMCRKGEVRVDGGRAKASTRVAPGAVIRVPPAAAEAPAPAAALRGAGAPDGRGAVPEAEIARIRAAVLFRDAHLLVLDKPPGLAVQGGSGQHLHLGTLLPWLRFDRDDDPRLVHRLDRDTSGVLVMARTGQAAVALARAFRSRATEKIYVALVAGCPEPREGVIRFGLAPGEGAAGRIGTKAGAGPGKMRVLLPDEVGEVAGARHALTRFRVVEALGTRAAWVALSPVTGRTHQLRAHMAALGCPIAGDGKYGGSRQENAGDGWGASFGQALSRKLHLHAARLSLPHPVTGARLGFSAPLPDHMQRSWDFFGWHLADMPDPVFED